MRVRFALKSAVNNSEAVDLILKKSTLILYLLLPRGYKHNGEIKRVTMGYNSQSTDYGPGHFKNKTQFLFICLFN